MYEYVIYVYVSLSNFNEHILQNVIYKTIRVKSGIVF